MPSIPLGLLPGLGWSEDPYQSPPAEVGQVDVYLWFEDARAKPKLLVNDLDLERMGRARALLLDQGA